MMTLMRMEPNDVWAIVPAHNEENRIIKVLNDIKKYVENIIVVDDGSTDNTYGVAKEKEVIVLRHVTNLGKGAALKTGCDFALKKEAKILIAVDADGQHDPHDIPRFLEALKGYDIVFGYRQMTKEMPFVFRFGNRFINFTTKLLYGMDMKDTQSGYRAFTSEAYKKIRWTAQNYDMESEMIANTGKHNLKYKEIPIQTIYPEKYKGTTIMDGVRIVSRLFWWRVTR